MQAGGNLPDMKNNPPDHPDYKSPKGGDRKVKNPNGRGSGWIDNKGRVWVPEDHNGNEAPHWDRQEPKGGGYTKLYPFVVPTTEQMIIGAGVVIGVGILIIITDGAAAPLVLGL